MPDLWAGPEVQAAASPRAILEGYGDRLKVSLTARHQGGQGGDHLGEAALAQHGARALTEGVDLKKAVAHDAASLLAPEINASHRPLLPV